MKCSICEYNQECKNKKRLVIGDVVKVIGPQDNQCDHGGAGMRWLEGRDICLGRIYRIVRKEL